MVCNFVQNFTDNTIVFDFDDEHLVGHLSVIVQKIFSFLESICHEHIACKDWLTWFLLQQKAMRFIKHVVFTKT